MWIGTLFFTRLRSLPLPRNVRNVKLIVNRCTIWPAVIYKLKWVTIYVFVLIFLFFLFIFARCFTKKKLFFFFFFQISQLDFLKHQKKTSTRSQWHFLKTKKNYSFVREIKNNEILQNQAKDQSRMKEWNIWNIKNVCPTKLFFSCLQRDCVKCSQKISGNYGKRETLLWQHICMFSLCFVLYYNCLFDLLP